MHQIASATAGELALNNIRKQLLGTLGESASRKEFFSELVTLLKSHFHFDRLCINLYDHSDGMLSYFTNAQGLVLRTLSPIRPAEESSTIAGLVISSQRPVVIPDLAAHFINFELHPMEEAGLKATIAVPLFFGRELVGTLHCSFARSPFEIQQICAFLMEVAKIVSPCLSAILGMELRQSLPQIPVPMLIENNEAIIHKSRVMKNIIRSAEAVAKHKIPVMILGETGTGKSMLAHYIHLSSPRKDANFVKVNCPALSPSLFESELFGHTKGAFTGAYTKRIGRFEFAHLGSLFLDEIGDLSLEMQSKLLQVLEDSRFERVGESTPLSVDIRLISATNAQIGESLAANKMRSDLYYRLSTHLIEIPPLRERKEDIPLYIKTFSSEVCTSLNIPFENIESAQQSVLMEYNWPGNLRELKNIITRIIISKTLHSTLSSHEVQELLGNSTREWSIKQHAKNASCGNTYGEKQISDSNFTGINVSANFHTNSSVEKPELSSLKEMEKRYLQEVLKATKGVVAGKNGAAAIAGIPRSTFLHKMKKLNIKTY